MRSTTLVFLLLANALPARAAEPDLAAELGQPILGVRQSVHETIEFAEQRIPRMPTAATAAEWTAIAERLRAEVLEKVVFRGEAAKWKDAPLKFEYLETIPGGPGYRIKKVRYEALPGLMIPALLYEPEALSGKVPVILNVNGHDGTGKAAVYKQIRCINQAKRGMLALNIEWVGMGQLRSPGFNHASLNQLDLCGTSGIAVHFLAQKRGIDLLLAHPHADPKRVAVTGLSGGAWQTIFISGLDPRVTLANPVAGYSSFLTRARHPKDLGDSEQTPCDLATVVDYTHLTAMRAPNPRLLTVNAADNCCFEAGYALPPLLRATEPIYRLYGKPQAIRSHINHVPGTHNYDRDNREAFYRMLGDFFYPGDRNYSATEIPADAEVRSAAELEVKLPEQNANFNTLALAIAKSLPRDAEIPTAVAAYQAWANRKRSQLRDVLRLPAEEPILADPAGANVVGTLTIARWRLRLGHSWTVPAVEFARGEPKKSAILLADGGRKNATAELQRLLDAGYRVLAMDPVFFGENDPIYPEGERREPTFKSSWLYALLLGAIGERPIGIQTAQVLAAARWLQKDRGGEPVTLAAVGPRTSLLALLAGAVAPEQITSVEVSNPLGSLKEAIEDNRAYAQTPEVFCFGLLEVADIRQLIALIAPRIVQVHAPTDRVRVELRGIETVYGLLGTSHSPLR